MAYQEQPPRRVPLREQLTPFANYENRAAIRLPVIEGQDYEINPEMITLVKQNQFRGLTSESPMDHIEDFEDLCSTTCSIGIPPDYLRCKLFSFSLSDKAHRWLKSLAPGSITSWDQCRAMFLNNFYTRAKTTELRKRIITFHQGESESFYEAWERFNEYLRHCPHHGYLDFNLLNIFYSGVEWKFQMALDTASRGDFSSNTAEEATTLINNLAASNSRHSFEYDRSHHVNSVESHMIAELNDKIDRLTKIDQRVLNRDGFSSSCADIDYGTNQNTGYQESPPQDDRIELMFQQVLDGQKNLATEINARVDGMFRDLNGKIDSLSTHMRGLESQVAETAKTLSETLPEESEINPNASIHAITLRSGEEVDSKSHSAGIDRQIDRSTSEIDRFDAMKSVMLDEDEDRSIQPRIDRSHEFSHENIFDKQAKGTIGMKSSEAAETESPYVNAVKMVPTLKEYMKDILTDKMTMEKGVMTLTHECGAILQNKLPEKDDDHMGNDWGKLKASKYNVPGRRVSSDCRKFNTAKDPRMQFTASEHCLEPPPPEPDPAQA